ncbi:NlpC/P60 family protein [Halobacillus sp. A1]|uniref:NlpC/P60 family protein n=1 Tax=Halobacillus sp. A1 TaxID=2880262 RepID=UPI0020A6347A|nr:NlpC/P60 family protein [Halobacillus sp. A1]MCP3031594.1 NlpC/P60 family protein [Halobacillus sp. A1]
MFSSTYFRKVAAVLVIPVTLMIPLHSVDASTQKFPDVNKGTIYYEPIQAMSGKDIVNGYTDGTFGIRDYITRAEAAVMLARLLELDTENAPAVPFEDVDQGKWYAGAINALFEKGIINGVSENEFDTYSNITRAALSKMIVNGYELQMVKENALPFTDVDEDEWYMSYLEVLYSHELISGVTTTTFEPGSFMRRGDFALLSYNTENKHGGMFLELEEAIATSAYQLQLNFSNGDTESIHLEEPLDIGENTRTFEYNQETFSETVTFEIPQPPEVSKDNSLVNEAYNYLGVPYLFGGDTPHGIDCSGFTRLVFDQAEDIYLPRTTDQQWEVGQDVEMDDIKPGDVVFFSDTYREGISHNGIYIGDGRFIHASSTQGVTLSYLSSPYWEEKFTGVKRFDDLHLPEEEAVVSAASQFIGEVPYQNGGSTPEDGFDTTGFIQYIYKQAKGIELPHNAAAQWEVGEEVAKEDLQPGDLVFFQANYLNPAIYAGNDQVVHVTPSQGVTVTNFKTSGFWGPKYHGAKRLVPEDILTENEESEMQ